jgi:hypothetical protein
MTDCLIEIKDENAELRAEVQRLRVRLGEGPPSSTTDSATSPTFDDKRTSFPVSGYSTKGNIHADQFTSLSHQSLSAHLLVPCRQDGLCFQNREHPPTIHCPQAPPPSMVLVLTTRWPQLVQMLRPLRAQALARHSPPRAHSLYLD